MKPERKLRTYVILISVWALSFSSMVEVPEEVSAYTPHAPIEIEGNENFTTANGVTSGSGTPMDPYVIEGWEINASKADGIRIDRTDAYFIIRDVYVHSGGGDFDGISFYIVRNGRIEDSVFEDNFMGIRLWAPRNVGIVNCTITSSHRYGIVGSYPEDMTIEDSEFSRNGSHGIYLTNSNNISISNNNMTDSIGIRFSTDVRTFGNTILTGIKGIETRSSSNFTISGNSVLDVREGMNIWHSSNFTIVENTVSADIGGIYLDDCTDSVIVGNSISDSEYGFYLTESRRVLIHQNNLVDNTIQAYDDMGQDNSWDNGYPSGGNYWNDYAGPDQFSGLKQNELGADGIGDNAYDISGDDGSDRYPLMNPIGPPQTYLPICAITAPKAGSRVSGIVMVMGIVYNPYGTVQEVEVRVDDDEWVRTTGATTWSHSLDTTAISDGEHTIYSRFYDGSEYSKESSVTVIVDNSPSQEDDWLWIAISLSAALILTSLVVLFLTLRRKRLENKES